VAGKVSIIIPAYNSEKDIPYLIRSLKAQSVKPMETILVDDCSTDGTQKVASEFFKVFKIPINLGPAAARNLGIKKARGKYLGFLDADCRPEPDWVEQIEKQLKDGKKKVVTGGVYVIARTFMGKAIASLGYPGGGSLGFEKMWRVAPDGSVEKICSGNLAIGREIIKSYGVFDESFAYCFEDAWLAYTLVKRGETIYYCPKMKVEHTATEDFGSFVRWHYARGQGMNPFQQKVGKLGSFIKLRIWSTGNIIRSHYKDLKLPMILMLLFLSIVMQKYAALIDKWREKH